MKQCANCGRAYDDNIIACEQCSVELTYVTNDTWQQPQQNMQYYVGQSQQNLQYNEWQQPQSLQFKEDRIGEKKPGNKRKIMISSAIALAVIAIIVAVIYLVGGTPNEKFYMENVPEELLTYKLDGESYTSEIVQVKIIEEEKDGDELEVECELYVEDECLTRKLCYEFTCEKDGKWEIEEYKKVDEDIVEITEEYANIITKEYQLDNIDNYQCMSMDKDGIIRFSYDVHDEYDYVTVGGTVIFEVNVLEERTNVYYTSVDIDNTKIEADWTIDGSYINTDDEDDSINMGVTLKATTDGQVNVEVWSGWLGLDYGTAELPTTVSFSQTGNVYCIVECEGLSPELEQEDRTYKIIFWGDSIYECRVNYDGGRGYFPLIPGDYDIDEILDANQEETGAEVSENNGDSGSIEFDKINNEPIYVYSWNSELEERMHILFRARYPEYSDLVVFVRIDEVGTSEEYFEGIDDAFEGSKPPSIVAYDIDAAENLNNGKYVPIYSSGITEEMYSQAYDYTKDVVTYDGNVMGMTWQIAPGCFVYDPAIAQKVLGFSDAESVNAAMEDWDAFLSLAETLKQNGYYIIPCIEDLTVGGGEATPQYVIDAVIENGYAGSYKQWSREWIDYPEDVFGYFGCSWFVYWSLDSDEDSRICQGPREFFWGGTYLGVTEECPNPELRKLVLYTLCCDEEAMYDLYAIDMDVPNNKASMEKLIADGKGGVEHLGEQDELPIFHEMGQSIDIE